MKVAYQQGDVILKKVEQLPKGVMKVSVSSQLIVERGEGVNTHCINDTDKVEVYDKDGVMYLKVTEPVNLVHEEHGIIEIFPGLYEKVKEREFDYDTEEARNVLD